MSDNRTSEGDRSSRTAIVDMSRMFLWLVVIKKCFATDALSNGGDHRSRVFLPWRKGEEMRSDSEHD